MSRIRSELGMYHTQFCKNLHEDVVLLMIAVPFAVVMIISIMNTVQWINSPLDQVIDPVLGNMDGSSG